MTIQRFHVSKRLSEIAIYNGTVYLTGQLAEDTIQNIEGQTRDTFDHIDPCWQRPAATSAMSRHARFIWPMSKIAMA